MSDFFVQAQWKWIKSSGITESFRKALRFNASKTELIRLNEEEEEEVRIVFIISKISVLAGERRFLFGTSTANGVDDVQSTNDQNQSCNIRSTIIICHRSCLLFYQTRDSRAEHDPISSSKIPKSNHHWCIVNDNVAIKVCVPPSVSNKMRRKSIRRVGRCNQARKQTLSFIDDISRLGEERAMLIIASFFLLLFLRPSTHTRVRIHSWQVSSYDQKVIHSCVCQPVRSGTHLRVMCVCSNQRCDCT